MQKVHNEKGIFIAIIKEDNTVVIICEGCQTTINLLRIKAVIETKNNNVKTKI